MTIDQSLDEETASFLDSLRTDSAGQIGSSWKEFFRNANNRLSYSQNSADEAYRSLPKIIRKIQKTQSSIDEFISGYYGTLASVFEKAKGTIASIFGLNYSPKGMQDVVAEQASNVRDAESTLELLVEHTEGVLEDIVSYHRELADGRAKAVGKLSDLKEVMIKSDRMKSQLVNKINELEMGNPDYHLHYRGITRLEQEIAGYEVESLQASIDLGAYSTNLGAVEAVLKVAGQGLKEATLARAGFHHSAELLEKLGPYFGLASDYGADYSWILKEAKNVHDSVGGAVSLSLEAFGSLAKLSSAATVHSGIPGKIAQSLGAYTASSDLGHIKSAYAEASRLVEHKGL
ncbi:MAG: hypothetical protein AABX51_03830 [Nanoarchaeota archaeon]